MGPDYYCPPYWVYRLGLFVALCEPTSDGEMFVFRVRHRTPPARGSERKESPLRGIACARTEQAQHTYTRGNFGGLRTSRLLCRLLLLLLMLTLLLRTTISGEQTNQDRVCSVNTMQYFRFRRLRWILINLPTLPVMIFTSDTISRVKSVLRVQ